MKAGVRHSLAALATLLVVAGASVVVWRTAHIGAQFYTDAEAIREPIGSAGTREVLWQPATALPGVINSEQDEYEPRISSDGATLFFVRGKAGGSADIYAAERTAGGWSEPAPLTAVNSACDDLGPAPSADGRALYFYSNRPGGFGGYDLWISRRGGSGWGEPVNLGPGVNSGFNEYGPAPTPDGSQIYFASDRPRPGEEDARTRGAWTATLREGVRRHDYDLFTAPVTESGVGAVTALTALNTAYDEGSPSVSPFGDFLYFSSDRPGGLGGFDLYRSRRLRGEQMAATNLGAAINSAANDLDPALSMGGFQIHFSSDRPVAGGETPARIDALASAEASTAPARPTYDIYASASREVFIETEPGRAVSALRSQWFWIALGLLTLLLTAALIYELLRRLKGSDGLRKLSLLARCLIASLVVHALLMLSFTVWRVSSAMGNALRTEGGATRVTISTPGNADGIASQIRSTATGFSIDAPSLDPVNRIVARMEPSRPFEVKLPVAPVEAAATRLEAPSSAPEAPSRVVQSPPIDASATLANLAAATIATKAPEQAVPIAREEASAGVSMPALANMERATHLDAVQAPHPSTVERVDVAPWSAPALPTKSTSAMIDSAEISDASPATGALASVERGGPPSSASASVAASQNSAGLRLPAAETAPRAGAREAGVEVSAANTRSSQAEVNLASQGAAHTPARAEINPETQRQESASVGSMASVSAPAESAVDATAEIAASRSDGATAARPRAVPLTPGALTRLPGDVRTPGMAALADARPSASAEEAHDLEVLGSQAAAAPRGALPRAVSTDGATSLLVDIAPSTVTRVGEPARDRGAIGDQFVDAAVGSAQSPRNEQPLAARATLGVEATPRVATRTPGEAEAAGREIAGDPGKHPRVDEAPAQDITSSGAHGVAGASSPRALSADGEASSIVQIAPTGAGKSPPSHDQRFAPRDAATIDAPIGASGAPGTAGAAPGAAAMASVVGGAAIDVRVPSETAAPGNPYRQREPEQRQAMIERLGGSPETERAVALALSWLERHQHPDGHWDGAAFDHDCGQCGGETNINSNVALTGLATLCFLAADHTHIKDGPYKAGVHRAIDWLLAHQSADGDLRSGETMYSHAIGAIALSEALGMTGDARLRDPVERAVAFIAGARNRKNGGWRYEPGMPGDTSVLGWQVMAMVSAKRAGIAPPGEALAAAADWLEKVSTSKKRGLYAYQPAGPPTESMTAEGMFVQQLLGASRDDPRMAQSAAFITRAMPNWRSGANTYGWYYATLALYQHQGPLWERWNEAVKRELLTQQRTMGGQTGSWDPVDRWSGVGGRVYQTAICMLSLEVYYRYLPMYVAFPGRPGPPPKIDALGAGDGAGGAAAQKTQESGPSGEAPIGRAAPE